MAALKAAGVAAKDIQTQQASLEPRYREGDREVNGFQAITTVSATIRSLDKVPATIDAAVTAGANTVYGPSLVSSNAARLYENALKAAVADALRYHRPPSIVLDPVLGVVKGDIGYIMQLGMVMLGVTLVQIVCSAVAVYYGARTSMALGRDLRAAIFHRALDALATSPGAAAANSR